MLRKVYFSPSLRCDYNDMVSAQAYQIGLKSLYVLQNIDNTNERLSIYPLNTYIQHIYFLYFIIPPPPPPGRDKVFLYFLSDYLSQILVNAFSPIWFIW